MNNILKLVTLTAALFLVGCVGPHASFSEKIQDNFLFTSADKIADSEKRCVTLTQPYTLESGSVSFSLPAGKYIAREKNSSGYFYYAPQLIKSSNSFFAFDQYGIYLNHQLNKGNVFGRNATGYDSRPVRGAVLPAAVFSYIKKTSC